MKSSTMELLLCPLCKERLKFNIEKKTNEDVVEGTMICCNCNKEYLIHNSIPRLYLPDNEIVNQSNNSRFSKFIITPENFIKWMKKTKTSKISNLLTNKKLTWLLVGFGWIFLFFAFVAVILSHLNFNSPIINKITLSFIYFFVSFSFGFFVFDYFRYRESSMLEYYANIQILKELEEEQKLSEYDIRTSSKDKETSFQNEFRDQKDFVAYKGKKITQKLDKYAIKGKNVLNVGCGGAIHKSVSKPYFDKGFDTIGVDISEEYLKQFNQIFNFDVVQANSMALPFRTKSFDLINFTDIVEHLHNPLFGLSEAQRVLKEGGLIFLTTNNHCAVTPRCLNPLVFVEPEYRQF